MSTVLKLTVAAVRILFILHDYSPRLILRYIFERPASLRARAPAPMQPRRALAEVYPHLRPPYFFRSLLTIFRNRPRSGSLFEGTQVVQGPSRRK